MEKDEGCEPVILEASTAIASALKSRGIDDAVFVVLIAQGFDQMTGIHLGSNMCADHVVDFLRTVMDQYKPGPAIEVNFERPN
jgi:hypothetical protein